MKTGVLQRKERKGLGKRALCSYRYPDPLKADPTNPFFPNHMNCTLIWVCLQASFVCLLFKAPSRGEVCTQHLTPGLAWCRFRDTERGWENHEMFRGKTERWEGR